MKEEVLCKVAVMDLGSQTFRLVAGQIDSEGARVIFSMRKNVRIGRSLRATGRFSRKSIERGLAALKEFKEVLARYSIEKFGAYATEAFRKAKNVSEFTEEARKIGINIEILTPEEEAKVAASGAYLTVSGLDKEWLMLDSGGGSTELVLSRGREVLAWKSMPVGAVNLTEELIEGHGFEPDRLRSLAAEKVRRWFGPLKEDFGKARKVVATGGTATTVAAVALGLSEYDPKKVRGFTIDEGELTRLFYQISEADIETRRSITGLEPERADIFPAGIAILLEIIRYLGLKKLIISDGGILLGLLAASIEKECDFYVEPSCARGLYL